MNCEAALYTAHDLHLFLFFRLYNTRKRRTKLCGLKMISALFFFFLLFWRILLWVGITSKRRRRSFRNILRAGWMFSVRWAWLCPLTQFFLVHATISFFFFLKITHLKITLQKKQTFRTVTKRYTFKCCTTTTKRIAEVNAVVDD